jgi:uncharacterized membrane protein
MGPEISLFAVFIITLGISLLRTGRYNLAFSGRAAMSAMLLIIGTGHFIFTKGISMMLPPLIPAREPLIQATGVFEFAAAMGLHLYRLRRITAWLLIVYFVLILPANIYAASIHLNEQTGALDGPGPLSLWYRVPMQLVFMAWIYLSAAGARTGLKNNDTINKKETIASGNGSSAINFNLEARTKMNIR